MENQDTGPEIQATEELAAKHIVLQKIYTKDISYEAPGTPEIYAADWTPQVSQEMSNSHRQIDEVSFESVLTVTITVKLGNKVAYLIEVSQAGIFYISGHSAEGLEKAFGIFCPTVLYPYVREIISDLSCRGGFPALVLQNANFFEMYHGYKKKVAAQGNTARGNTAKEDDGDKEAAEN